VACADDYREFGAWFRVKLEAAFEVGRLARGQITYSGHEHVKWQALIEAMEPERLFAFAWHPYAIDPTIDYSKEPTTRVEFRLERKGTGTLLIVTESSFDAIPKERRFEAYRMNDGGWSAQMQNSTAHVERRRT
jgi:uncharacterized protein YndB with AHSA1/START domain